MTKRIRYNLLSSLSTLVERGGELPSSLSYSRQPSDPPPSLQLSPPLGGCSTCWGKDGWRWQRLWWEPAATATERPLLKRHAACSWHATSTPPLSHLPPPGVIPWVRGQWWLGEGVVRSAWRTGETHPHLQHPACSNRHLPSWAT